MLAPRGSTQSLTRKLVKATHGRLNPEKQHTFPPYLWLDCIRVCESSKTSPDFMYKLIYRNKQISHLLLIFPSEQHCTLLLTIHLHDRLDNERTVEGQKFRLSAALILPHFKCDSR